MRILSLLPAATEIVYLLGLEKYLVGVSHECDYPKQASKLPKITSSPISNDLSSLEINTQVAKLKHKGSGVFHIDEQKLKKARPNLILTQELCDVCAISWTQVSKASKVLEGDTKIISLEPESIEDIMENILTIGEATEHRLEAKIIIKRLKERIKNLKLKIRNSTTLPRVLLVEWLDPLMVAGHWVPEMVEKARGINLITIKGQKSYPISIDQIVKVDPDTIIFAPCGFNIKRTLREKQLIDDLRLKINDPEIKFFLLDGNSYLTRPGPRIIDGVEILAQIFHPDLFPRTYPKSSWRSLTNKSG